MWGGDLEARERGRTLLPEWPSAPFPAGPVSVSDRSRSARTHVLSPRALQTGPLVSRRWAPRDSWALPERDHVSSSALPEDGVASATIFLVRDPANLAGGQTRRAVGGPGVPQLRPYLRKSIVDRARVSPRLGPPSAPPLRPQAAGWRPRSATLPASR